MEVVLSQPESGQHSRHTAAPTRRDPFPFLPLQMRAGMSETPRPAVTMLLWHVGTQGQINIFCAKHNLNHFDGSEAPFQPFGWFLGYLHDHTATTVLPEGWLLTWLLSCPLAPHKNVTTPWPLASTRMKEAQVSKIMKFQGPTHISNSNLSSRREKCRRDTATGHRAGQHGRCSQPSCHPVEVARGARRRNGRQGDGNQWVRHEDSRNRASLVLVFAQWGVSNDNSWKFCSFYYRPLRWRQ